MKSDLLKIGVGALAVGMSSVVIAEEKAKPNIVFILVDDMGWSDVGCYGGEIKTPNIDSLAKSGVRFTQCYNTAKCFPSRATLLTGLYAQQSGMDRGYSSMQNSVTLGEVLRENGYRTLASGKHHCNENLYDRGFDHYYGLRDGCCNFWNPGEKREGEPEPGRKRYRNWCDDGKTMKPYTPEDKKFYATDAFTNKALQWLDEPEVKDKPFFLYLAYNAPHYPLHAWPEDIAKYKGVYDKGYEEIQKIRYKKQIEMGLIDPKTTPMPESPKPTPWSDLEGEELAKEKLRMEIYAAMLDRVDQNVGRLLDKLRKIGKLDNTLIFFASDNGACAEGSGGKIKSKKIEDFGKVASYEAVGKNWATVQNTPLRFWKNSSYEGGICTPLIVSGAGLVKKPGSFCRQPVHFIDIMATLVDLTNAQYPETYKEKKIFPMQGTSILPALKNKQLKREGPLFWQWAGGKAIRKGDIKAVSSKNNWQLYDLSKSRNENVPLEDPEKLQSMIDEWQKWYDEATAWKKKGKGK